MPGVERWLPEPSFDSSSGKKSAHSRMWRGRRPLWVRTAINSSQAVKTCQVFSDDRAGRKNNLDATYVCVCDATMRFRNNAHTAASTAPCGGRSPLAPGRTNQAAVLKMLCRASTRVPASPASRQGSDALQRSTLSTRPFQHRGAPRHRCLNGNPRVATAWARPIRDGRRRPTCPRTSSRRSRQASV